MQKSFFLSAILIQSWFKGKIPFASAKIHKKNHSCAWIQIPVVYPLMKKLFPFYLERGKDKERTFQLQKDNLLHLSIDSSKQEAGDFSSKKFTNQPFKEHLLAKNRLEQNSTKRNPSGYQTCLLFSTEETPTDWHFSKREEERQFQIDRSIPLKRH